MRRVVKVGGSLLERGDLTSDLGHWLTQQTTAETLVVVGGGSLVEAIRTLDAIRPMDAVETHWICVELLDVTFRVMSSWSPWPTVSNSAQLRQGMTTGFSRDQPTLVAVRAFYGRDLAEDDAGRTLPCNWQTTTDAIAALLAWRVAADELVILKSCDIDPALSLEQLAARGIVDEAISLIAKNIPSIRVECL